MTKFENNLGPQEKEINLFLEKMEEIGIGAMIRLNAYESRNDIAGIRNHIELRNRIEDLVAAHGRERAYSMIKVVGVSLFEKYKKIWEETFDALDEIAPFEDFGVLQTIQAASIGDTVNAARNALRGLLMRDFLYAGDYYTLTETWRTIVGPIHPDDPDLIKSSKWERGKRWSFLFSKSQPPSVGITSVKTYPSESE